MPRLTAAFSLQLGCSVFPGDKVWLEVALCINYQNVSLLVELKAIAIEEVYDRPLFALIE